MGDYYYATFDLELIRSRLSAADGHSVSMLEVHESLSEQGFEQTPEGWVIKSTDLTTIRHDEIISLRSLDDGTVYTNFVGETNTGSVETPRSESARAGVLERLNALPDSNLCLIPDFLIGDYRSVVSRSRVVIKRLIQSGDWSIAMKKVKFVPLIESDFRLIAGAGVGGASAAM